MKIALSFGRFGSMYFAVGAALVASAAVLAQPSSLVDHKCKGYQSCRHVPTCPTVTGTCNSCTAFAENMECQAESQWACIPGSPQAGGCGTVREGTCDANNTCSFVVTDEACNRDMCSNVGEN